MKVLDPGHAYQLDVLSGVPGQPHEPDSVAVLSFVKREGAGYPGNVGHHDGTIDALREAIWLLELRAADRHKRELIDVPDEIEHAPTCPKCGHVDPERHEHE